MIEESSMNTWPCLQHYMYDGWIIRFANGYTKRSNSINPIYWSKINIENKIDCCESLFRKILQKIIYKITPISNPTNLDSILEKNKYSKIDETIVKTMRHIAIEVEDFGATIQTLKNKGIEIIDGPGKRMDGSDYLFCNDPDGNLIEIVKH